MPKGVAADKDIPFRIGSDHCAGLSKLTEEMGETQVEVGKIEGLGHMGEHWGGKGDLKTRLEDEIADTWAAQEFVIRHNDLNRDRMWKRTEKKLDKFERWHRNIQAGRDPNDNG